MSSQFGAHFSVTCFLVSKFYKPIPVFSKMKSTADKIFSQDDCQLYTKKFFLEINYLIS